MGEKMILKNNDFVRVKYYPVYRKGVLVQGRKITDSDDPDYEARVSYVTSEGVWITNANMPFLGTISAFIPNERIDEFLEVKTKPKSAYDKQSLKAPKEWWVYEDRLFRASFHTEKDAIEFVKLHRASGCNYNIKHQPLDKSPYFK